MRVVTHKTTEARRQGVTLVLLGVLGLGFASCQSPHNPTTRSEAPPPRRAETNIDPGWPHADRPFVKVSYQAVHATVPKLEGAEMVNDDDICMQCHEAYVKSFHDNVHRVISCEGCHGPGSRHVETRGKEPGLIFSFKKGTNPIVRAEMCLKCHEQDQCQPGAQWRTSKHAQCGVTCVDCHRGHYNVPPGTPAVTEPKEALATPAMRATLVSFNEAEAAKKNLPSLRGTSHHLGAMAPDVCLKCHADMRDLLRIAGPHQIGGPNGFNCTTCHDPHGQIRESTRKDLCLSCHKNSSPTMAWHASTHERYGVSCTDCHNPHPHANTRQVVNITHFGVEQPKRLAMSVQEPEACYKCHQRIFAMNQLPAHHPILEGKMVCSDCHDPHGQMEKNLKAETINLLCYKCHAEKAGPFAYPHQPVNENCDICHQPHGTVANNLLRQPPTFLCLRCHTGHNRPTSVGHPTFAGVADLNASPALRPGYYTNCTECHAQVHGSDVPSPSTPNATALFR